MEDTHSIAQTGSARVGRGTMPSESNGIHRQSGYFKICYLQSPPACLIVIKPSRRFATKLTSLPAAVGLVTATGLQLCMLTDESLLASFFANALIASFASWIVIVL